MRAAPALALFVLAVVVVVALCEPTSNAPMPLPSITPEWPVPIHT